MGPTHQRPLRRLVSYSHRDCGFGLPSRLRHDDITDQRTQTASNVHATQGSFGSGLRHWRLVSKYRLHELWMSDFLTIYNSVGLVGFVRVVGTYRPATSKLSPPISQQSLTLFT